MASFCASQQRGADTLPTGKFARTWGDGWRRKGKPEGMRGSATWRGGGGRGREKDKDRDMERTS